jgi:predicted dehydrogenase
MNIRTHNIGIIMNGVTGRMGTNQHLMRSIIAIIQQGGVKIGEKEIIMPDPILVGRNPVKLERLATMAGVTRWTTDLDKALANTGDIIYFDAQTTDRRVEAVKKAIAAGKHVYCEKPTATTTADALELYKLAKAAGVKNGVVQDKLWLPGLLKLKLLIQSGFFGRILSVRGEFGYWVFEGDTVPAQRPSWNYRKEEGGGIIIDMLCHFRYVLDNLFGNVQAVSCLGARHINQRWDENGKAYESTADDAAYSTFELAGGIIAHINASWCAACAATICSRCKWMEQKAAQLPACDTAGFSHTQPRLAPLGIPISTALSISTTAGSKYRRSKTSRMPSRSSGNFSSAMLSKMSRFPGRCSKAQKAFNSPKRASNHGNNENGSLSRLWRHKMFSPELASGVFVKPRRAPTEGWSVASIFVKPRPLVAPIIGEFENDR